jgi:hypothetical protein
LSETLRFLVQECGFFGFEIVHLSRGNVAPRLGRPSNHLVERLTEEETVADKREERVEVAGSVAETLETSSGDNLTRCAVVD